ncbi:hypothetical protein HELRODRAFT_116728 [Helobdella robusta]|uniref:Uncharacterized protein n=1 Tax=Helobdella robusta TaxID=6412 RepID=T1EGH3_HELRO|nr:hypothetical protein HELRODRAFT_116728 [Helobdella robusta]ESN89858.1 hypothetical protein HELRODRAFT_116728 [Helobdella robusta]
MYVQSMLGIQQEVMFKKYGCYPDEAVFYCHVVLLPFYIFLVGDMREQVKHLNNSESMVLVGWLGWSLPRQWIFIIGSVFSNLICIKSIYWLTSCYSSLTVAMIVTLRKFISLIVSLTYFDNIFTFYHWLATFFIFSGTLLFVDEVSTFGDEGVKRALRFGMSCFCGTDGSGRGVSGVVGGGGGSGNDVAGGGRNGVAAVDGTDDDRSRNGGVVRRRVESGLEDRNTNNSIKE